MFNYLGPNTGPDSLATKLPPATPGTIPDGVPGVPSTPAPLPPPLPIQGRAIPSPGILSAIQNNPAMPGQSAPEPPPPPEYGVTTQEDGSILLHVKYPDGTLGPVVKVIPPIKRPGAEK